MHVLCTIPECDEERARVDAEAGAGADGEQEQMMCPGAGGAGRIQELVNTMERAEEGVSCLRVRAPIPSEAKQQRIVPCSKFWSWNVVLPAPRLTPSESQFTQILLVRLYSVPVDSAGFTLTLVLLLLSPPKTNVSASDDVQAVEIKNARVSPSLLTLLTLLSLFNTLTLPSPSHPKTGTRIAKRTGTET